MNRSLIADFEFMVDRVMERVRRGCDQMARECADCPSECRFKCFGYPEPRPGAPTALESKPCSGVGANSGPASPDSLASDVIAGVDVLPKKGTA